jgi:hypothetical protein
LPFQFINQYNIHILYWGYDFFICKIAGTVFRK